MNTNEKKIKYITALFLILITVVPFFMLCAYNVPMASDVYKVLFSSISRPSHFSYTFFGLRSSVELSILKLFWKTIHPLSLETIKEISFFYHIAAFLHIIGFCTAFLYLCYKINTHIVKLKKESFFLFYSVMLFLLFMAIIPANFFYEQVSTGYSRGIIWFFIVVGLFIDCCTEKSKKRKVLKIVLLFVITYWDCFFLEYNSIICGFFFFSCLLYIFVMHKKIDTLSLSLLLFCIFCFFMQFITNPSNLEPKYAPTSTIGDSSAQTFLNILSRYFLYWCYDTAKYFFEKVVDVFYLIPLYCALGWLIGSRLLDRKIHLKIIFVILLYAIIPIVAFTLLYAGFASGAHYPYLTSTLNILFLFITVILFASFYQHIVSKNSEGFKSLSSSFFSKRYVCIVGVLYMFFIGCFHSGNPISRAWDDALFSKTAKQYSEQFFSDFDTIVSTSDKNLELSFFDKIPESIFNVQGGAIEWNDSEKYHFAETAFLKYTKKDSIIWR